MINRRSFLISVTAAAAASVSKSISADEGLDTAPEIEVTLRDAHKGTPAIDMNLLNSYGRQPEPIQSFFAEARAVFDADRQARFAVNRALERTASRHGMRHLGGPMLGGVGEDRAAIWLRTVKPSLIRVEVKGPDGVKRCGPAPSTVETDLTAIVPLTGLRPATRYDYQVFIDDKRLELGRKTTFSTFPRPEKRGTFKLAFGGDYHKAGVHNVHLMRQIVQRGNQAMILTGDLATDDRNNQTGLHRSDYLLRDLSPAWQSLAAAVPIYAAWDDHDYFDNDLAGIPKGFTAADVRAVREIWTQNWNNPAYGEAGEGIYFCARLGPADLIVLDTRSLRKEQRKSTNAYLGERQMQWLKRELLSCKGPFVIISSGTMWSDYISNGKDSWGVCDPAGREELFSFIEEHNIPGVLLICCDRHGA
ncbi:MAG: alkaline phosphatase D family protein, partial [Sedimentisphaerales bacterium]|nr:alkaline phosphatase D family protein [Sedimentisphaerales bacterium]